LFQTPIICVYFYVLYVLYLSTSSSGNEEPFSLMRILYQWYAILVPMRMALYSGDSVYKKKWSLARNILAHDLKKLKYWIMYWRKRIFIISKKSFEIFFFEQKSPKKSPRSFFVQHICTIKIVVFFLGASGWCL